MKKNNLHVLVTGASRGIGQAIAIKLSKRCSKLFLTSKKEGACLNTINKIGKDSPNIYYTNLNHETPSASSQQLYEWVKNKTDYLDAIVLVAGIFIEGNLSTFPSADFEKNINVNLSANHYIINQLIPFLKKAATPRIIIIGSTAAYKAYPIVPSYGMIKWALRGYASNLRKELSLQNIGVTFLSPGSTLTDMWGDEEIPAGRLLEPSDIANVVDTIFELSDQAVLEEVIVSPMLGDYDED